MSAKVYEMVTAKILAALEQGIIPWERPWSGVAEGAFNRISKQPYSLLNQFLLGIPGEWATFKQWTELGGKIKRGEKASVVVFWKQVKGRANEDDGEDEASVCEDKLFFMLRYYQVFHISQVDGVEPLKENNQPRQFEWNGTADEVLEEYSEREHMPIIYEKGNRAFYRPSEDAVHLPLREQFKSEGDFYSTAFHEVVHSTMTKERCNRVDERKGKEVRFGNEEYSKEELVVEIGSSFLMNLLRLENKKTERNTIAYIQSWIRALKNDPKMIVWASSRAEKAAKFILGTNDSEMEEVA